MAEAHFRLGGETQLLGRVWRDLSDVRDNLCSRMHNHHREKTTEAQGKRLQGINEQREEEAGNGQVDALIRIALAEGSGARQTRAGSLREVRQQRRPSFRRETLR